MGLGLAGAILPAPVRAQQPVATAEQGFDIPAQDLNRAVLLFSARSGIRVLYDTASVAGLQSRPVSGVMTPQQAIAILLAGTGVGHRFEGSVLRLIPPGAAAADIEGAVPLDPITVLSDGAVAGFSGYLANASRAGTKTDVPLTETARSIDVIGRDEMTDRDVTNVTDAVRYASGVVADTAGFDPRFEQVRIRGFSTTTSGDFRDGLRQVPGSYATFRTEPWGLERVDVVKGPISTLYGQSGPGGVIDVVSKRPTGGRVRELMVSAQDSGLYTLGVDLGDSLNAQGSASYRVVALARKGEQQYHIQDDRFMLAPSVSFELGDDTRMTILAQVQRDETDSNVAALNRGGLALPIRASDPGYDFQKQDQFQLGYELEHRFTDTLTFVQNLRVARFDTEARYLTGGVTGGGWQTDANGTAYYARGTFALANEADTVQVDNRLTADLQTGPVRHRLMMGVDYQWIDQLYVTGSSAADPAYDLYPDDPQYGRGGATPAYSYGRRTESSQWGLYVQDMMEFGDWRASLGLRRDRAERDQVNSVTGTRTAQQSDSATTYNAGLLYAGASGLSPYVNFATSFLPTSYVDASGAPLPPSEGEQVEIGVKYAPEGMNALFTAALYRIREKNAAVYAGYSSTIGSYYESVGETTIDGIELSARGQITPNLSVVVSYTHSNAEITDHATASYIGNTPSLTPEHVLNAWVDYTVPGGPLHGLSLGAGLRHYSKSYTSSANTSVNEAMTLWDAALRYDFGLRNPSVKGLEAALNVSNLGDERVTTCASGYCYLGEGRSVSLTVNYRF